MNISKRCNAFVACIALCLVASAYADRPGSRIIATGAVSTIEGSAGGGIVPMAVLSGYGSKEEHGGAVFASKVSTADYGLSVVGASWSYANRVEVSLAQQTLEHGTLSSALGVADTTIAQRVLGLKVRLAGDVLYSAIPQISVGLQHKLNLDFFIPSAAGAVDDSGVDMYASASKVYLGGAAGYNLLLNTTLRATKANQTGLVGFGGDKNGDYQLQAELSAGVFLNKHLLIGAEYRQKPDNLSFAAEDDWQTAFVSWFPNKRLAVVAGVVNLGEVATLPNQTGWYFSLQGSL